ncbi:MAG: amidohydrolase family protein [Gammaproteobacteria bacterium]|nr:amidohydrolase family protein [Gammaproteobacteria bacterium]MDH5309597.1 amidohydrolase family protein [Gammaproteobacteria bacterium]
MPERSTPALVALAVLGLCACTPPEQARGIAISDVTVIDATNGVREHQTVIFDGDEITAVLPADGPIPAVTDTIDGSGGYLIPGLWDMHVHLTYDERFTEAMPAMFLAYGITSVRDTGGMIPLLEPVVGRMRAPDAIAPRVFFSGPLQDGRFVVYDGDSRPEIGAQNATPEAARASVNALADAGVDFIKVYEMVTPAVFEALVGTARQRGLPVAAHVPLSMLASQAGPAVDSMEHLRNIELDCADNGAALYEERLTILNSHEQGAGFELRSRLHALQRLPAIGRHDEARCARTIATLASTIQVPTLRLLTLSLHPPFVREDWADGLSHTPAEAAADWARAGTEWLTAEEPRDTTYDEWGLRMVGRMHAAGVPIAAGTDTPIGYAIPGYSLHTELERLVEAGLAPLEAIGAATLRPAEFFSLQGEMGAIEAGMRADLVLLDADPLADIRNTRRIRAVVSKGQPVN